MSTSYEDRLRRVLNYIYDNPTGDLSLDNLADVAAMSRFHWHRVFHAMTGETCAQAVRRVRTHRAACWLVQRDWPVAEVSAKAGFDSPQAFRRVFRQMFGASPSEFRAAGRHVPPLHLKERKDQEMFDVEIREMPERRLAALAHKGAYMDIGRSFQEVGVVFSARNLWPHAQGMAGVYYDDPDATAEADLRSHAGVILADGAQVPEGLESVPLTGGSAAVLTFKGPYSGLKAAYGHLYGDWLPKSGHTPAEAPPYEVYLNDPSDTAPDELLTEIVVPLA